MKESYTSKKRVRKNFGRIDAVIDMPSLIEVQTGSYNSFINNVDMYGNHCEFGLEEVFKSISPSATFPATACWSLSSTNCRSRSTMSKNA